MASRGTQNSGLTPSALLVNSS
uniref:Uncharacterized protein n=1 Tax=Rhizophora mucronata TaxID=61149 RepID=A0A2P2NXN0_RHIMU